MTAVGERPIATFTTALAARLPTPGGGAAAAVTAALGCAAGAMAARYTTGEKWADRSAAAEALALSLDVASRQALALADEDESAFAAAQAARTARDTSGIAMAQSRAGAIPLALARLCADQAEALVHFQPLCNPQLISDVRVGIHLLVGAACAASATLSANSPSPDMTAAMQEVLGRCVTANRLAG